MTLPSDASTLLFPANRAHDFRTRLPQQIRLHGDKWEVGLAEITFPLNLQVIRSHDYNNQFTIMVDPVEGKSTPPPAHLPPLEGNWASGPTDRSTIVVQMMASRPSCPTKLPSQLAPHYHNYGYCVPVSGRSWATVGERAMRGRLPLLPSAVRPLSPWCFPMHSQSLQMDYNYSQ